LNTGVSHFCTCKDLALGHGESTRSNHSDRLPVIGWGAVDNQRNMKKADGVAFVRYVQTATETMELNMKAPKLAFCNNEMLVVITQLLHQPLKLNSVALVYTRTIPTERPPPVGEVSANFCG